MLRTLRRLQKTERGTAAIEFALIAPLMVLVAAGIVEIGLIFKVYNGVNRLASQYAIGWSDCYDTGTACQTEMSNYSTERVVKNMAPQLNYASISKLQLFQVQMVGNTPTVVYVSSKDNTNTLSAAQIAAAQAMLDAGNVGIIVTVTYSHTLQFFSSLMPSYITDKLNPSYTIVQLKY